MPASRPSITPGDLGTRKNLCPDVQGISDNTNGTSPSQVSQRRRKLEADWDAELTVPKAAPKLATVWCPRAMT